MVIGARFGLFPLSIRTGIVIDDRPNGDVQHNSSATLYYLLGEATDFKSQGEEKNLLLSFACYFCL